MAREKHPNFALVTRARTSRHWDTTHGKDTNCVLVIQPNDIQFADLIKKAGVEVDDEHVRDLLDDAIVPLIAPGEPTKFSLDDEIAHDPYAKFKGD
jgi:hypothetical protein